jgi:hypothetical protein
LAYMSVPFSRGKSLSFTNLAPVECAVPSVMMVRIGDRRPLIHSSTAGLTLPEYGI